MAKDIVCGKEVDEKGAVTTKFGDQPFYFCSKKCEGDFVGNPTRYTNPSGAVASTEGSPTISATGQRGSSKV